MPLLVNFPSTSTDSDFVVYNCTVSSVTSKKAWAVSYRYSEFVDFRTKLDDQWTCHDARCSGSCQALRDIVAAYFPKKRLAVLSAQPGAIASRKKKFELVLTHLLRSVLLPGSVMKCLHAREQLPDNVFEFLGVKAATDRRSLLQIFVDNYQTVLEEGNGVSQPDTPECMICLSNMGDNQQRDVESSDTDSSDEDTLQLVLVSSDAADNAQITLPCKHSFHRQCIFQWLLVEFHCPVCRANLCPNAFTNYCRVRRCKPQWWLGDFEEDLLHTDQTG